MRRKRISEIITNIDENLVAESVQPAAKSAPSGWIKRCAAAAACLAITAGVALFALNSRSGSVMLGGVERQYKSNSELSLSETGLIFGWDYLLPQEQYNTAMYNGSEYSVRGWAAGAQYIGGSLGIVTASGYDYLTEEQHFQEVEVYSINGIPTESMIAVKLGGEYFPCLKSGYNPPETLGGLMESYNLPETLELYRFTLNEDSSTTQCYALEDDTAVWELLRECGSAEFVEDDKWSYLDKEYVGFTASSEALGVYKNAFYVTADGFLWTNIFNYGYIYDIGEAAAAQIITYSTENSVETDYEPYYYTLAGTITEIADDYILVDDSIMCRRESDGMIFRIPTDNLRISRILEHITFEIGDTVAVNFLGTVDTSESNRISNVRDISPAIIEDGEAMVQE